QLVGYPIFSLEHLKLGVREYIHLLEEAIIRTIAHFGIKGERLNGATGVWIEINNPQKVRKICAIGVRCSHWVTMHGFALNVNTDLTYFQHINPCGFTDKAVTSIEKEIGHKVDFQQVTRLALQELLNIYGFNSTE
ncbi:MAG: lipoyl(octanoyl) transferase LipB, partial [Bacteroidales bacterium]|nr:lipoyl(octanoyl) transferase LipB [Bacteroidales bacterium]